MVPVNINTKQNYFICRSIEYTDLLKETTKLIYLSVRFIITSYNSVDVS